MSSPILIFLKKTKRFNIICNNKLMPPIEETINPKYEMLKIIDATSIRISVNAKANSVPNANENKLLYILIVSLTGEKCEDALFSI